MAGHEQYYATVSVPHIHGQPHSNGSCVALTCNTPLGGFSSGTFRHIIRKICIGNHHSSHIKS